MYYQPKNALRALTELLILYNYGKEIYSTFSAPPEYAQNINKNKRFRSQADGMILIPLPQGYFI